MFVCNCKQFGTAYEHDEQEYCEREGWVDCLAGENLRPPAAVWTACVFLFDKGKKIKCTWRIVKLQTLRLIQVAICCKFLIQWLSRMESWCWSGRCGTVPFDQVGKVPLCISFDHIDIAPTMHTPKPYTKVAATYFERYIKVQHSATCRTGCWRTQRSFSMFQQQEVVRLGFEPMGLPVASDKIRPNGIV